MASVCILAVISAPLYATPGSVPAEITQATPPVLTHQDPASLPHIVLLSMGGTIASRATSRLNITNYGGKGVPRTDPEDWVRDLPELANFARVTIEDFRPPENTPLDSPVPGPENFAGRQRVARRLNELAQDPSVDGIVVSHGTDTMTEVAYYMDLVVKAHKPIVFVGSQRPWTGISGDGPLNLYDAVRVAASKDAWDKGVLHCMNQTINTARDLMKTSAYRVQTFKGVDVGAIGFADPDRVLFYRETLRKHTAASAFAGVDYTSLPEVEIVYSYQEAPAYLIDAMVEHGVKGIVVDGTGAGNPTAFQSEAIKRARAKGVAIVVTTRTRGGRVQVTPRRLETGVISGDNFQPEKARLLLQLALTKASSSQDLQKYFDEY